MAPPPLHYCSITSRNVRAPTGLDGTLNDNCVAVGAVAIGVVTTVVQSDSDDGLIFALLDNRGQVSAATCTCWAAAEA